MDYTEQEIALAVKAHGCSREEAISTYAAMVRSARQAKHAENLLASLRQQRDLLLAATDWWVLPDRTPTQEQLDYRQALRDITDSYTSIHDVVWPTEPEG